jgi:hypothetical protein
LLDLFSLAVAVLANMASLASRPGYARQNTDISMQNMGQKNDNDTGSGDDIKKQDTPSLSEKVPEITETETGLPAYDARRDSHFGEPDVVTSAKDIVTHVLHVDDDPSLNPWTFRMFFLGESSLLRCP